MTQVRTLLELGGLSCLVLYALMHGTTPILSTGFVGLFAVLLVACVLLLGNNND